MAKHSADIGHHVKLFMVSLSHLMTEVMMFISLVCDIMLTLSGKHIFIPINNMIFCYPPAFLMLLLFPSF
jgi:hypothetical protein